MKINTILLFIFFSIVILNNGFTQNNLSNDKENVKEINLVLEKGDEYFNDKNYENAEKEYDRINPNLKNVEWEYSVEMIQNLASKYHNLGKKHHFSNYEYAIRNYSKSINLLYDYQNENNIIKERISDSYNNLGKIYYRQGKYGASLIEFEKTYKIRRAINKFGNKKKVCIDQGRSYSAIGEYEKAKSKYNEALEIDADGISISDKNRDVAANNIGAMYITMGKEKEALPYLKQSLIYREENKKENILANTHYNLGMVYFALSEYEKAMFHYGKAIFFYEKQEDFTQINKIWNSIGELLTKQREFSKAKIAIRDSAIIQLNYVDDNEDNNLQYTSSYHWLAHVFLEEGQPDSAVYYSELAINKLLGNEKLFPSIKTLEGINKIDFLDYQYLLAKGMIAKGESESALDILFYCDSVIIQSIRNSHSLDQSKLFWQGKTRGIYEDAIKIALELDKIETAFNFSQKSKALTLLNKINANVALEETNLPEKIINEKRRLESKIISLENNIGMEPLSIGKLNQARDEYDKFIVSLEKDYTEYYKLKYNNKIPSIKEIQNSLLKNNNEVIIEYFLGDSAVYVFGITKKTGVGYYILENRNDILKSVKKLNELSINRFSKSDEFSKISNKIYQQLIAPVTSEITGIHKLIIAPDDSLFLVPFKALVMEESDNNFKDLPYMIKKYSINECYSSTFLYTMMMNNENPAKKINRIKVLGIAPEFNGNSEYGILKENIKGIRQGIHFFNKNTSDTLFREQATAMRFTEQLGTENYDIVYISSHAEKGEPNKNENTIVLHESKLQQNEIEGLWTSHVKMIVLSACKTGDGETVKGEAPISLGWGFASTNIPSVTASLWNMDDETATVLMNNYFNNLVRQKASKSQALTEGIRTFLNGNEIGYHPYYWAGVIHYGDDRAIVSNGLSTFLVIGIGLAAIILVLGFYLKSKVF